MCGIAGIISRHSQIDTKNIVGNMVENMLHRGPNGRGSVIRQCSKWSVGLGNTRLAILDLSDAGSQPMKSNRNSSWVTHNGEIYNFRELRSELESINFMFKSKTDTEVVLSSYEAWGCNSIQRFQGMFGFGIWDESNRRFFLARDPFGIKPLYYYQSDDIFIFASEIRAILATGIVPRKLSSSGLSSYLHYGSVESPLTIIEGIKSLNPGHYMTVDLKDDVGMRSDEVAYVNGIYSQESNSQPDNRDDAVKMLREVLENSISSHLVSDVPVGVFLSGGIDSSSIVALMSQVCDKKPKTFNVSFLESDFSEAAHSHFVAKKFGSRHHEICLRGEELQKMLPDALNAMDQPSVDGINTYVISGAVKNSGISVALSGLSGDELFGGYPSFSRAKKLEFAYKFPLSLRKKISEIGRNSLNGSVRLRKFWDLLEGDCNPWSAYSISREFFSYKEVQSLLTKTVNPYVKPPYIDSSDYMKQVSIYEICGYMANTLLRDSDCMSMAHSLEVRFPFLDPKLVGLVLGLQRNWKERRGQKKPLLVDSVSDILPKKIWKRPKMGFELPIGQWMQLILKKEIGEVLSNKKKFEELGIRSKEVHSHWEMFLKNPEAERWGRPWALYVLSNWCEKNHVT